ncbi:hypothetical protein WJX82_009369 [Trebouxia sp. C0006]
MPFRVLSDLSHTGLSLHADLWAGVQVLSDLSHTQQTVDCLSEANLPWAAVSLRDGKKQLYQSKNKLEWLKAVTLESNL